MGAFDFSIDVDLVESLRTVLPLSVFVETGTFEGDAVERMLPFFDELHSIELAEDYHSAATNRFKELAKVALHRGDSRDVLKELQPALRWRSVLYWLDAHWCVAESTAGETSQCPLLEELDAIAKLNRESTILIDDARLFLATPPAPHEVAQWPRFHEVVQKLLSLSNDHEITVVNDVIAFHPENSRQAVAEYSRSRGMDLLALTHRVKELEQECAAQTLAAAERLRSLEELTRERDLQAGAAQERLLVLEELLREREERAEAGEDGSA